MKRPYGQNKSARLPGARISEEFKELLKNEAERLKISQARLIELAVREYVKSPDN